MQANVCFVCVVNYWLSLISGKYICDAERLDVKTVFKNNKTFKCFL